MTSIRFDCHTLRIDDCDLHLLEGVTLRIRKVGSDASPIWYAEFKHKGITTQLQRLVMNFPDGVIDHINGDGLDNRKENLRVCSHAENMQNRRIHSNNKCGVKGIYFDAKRQKYRANIRAFGKKHYLGDFKDIEQAKAAYIAGAARLHGAFYRSE